MGKYDNSANTGRQLIIKFIKERRKEKNISQEKLGELIDVDKSTIFRYEKCEIDIPLLNLLKICGALELRPFFIPAEIDNTEFERKFFN